MYLIILIHLNLGLLIYSKKNCKSIQCISLTFFCYPNIDPNERHLYNNKTLMFTYFSGRNPSTLRFLIFDVI